MDVDFTTAAQERAVARVWAGRPGEPGELLGSAFLVGADEALTAQHVVTAAGDQPIWLENAEWRTKPFVTRHEIVRDKLDVAYLRLNEAPAGAEVLGVYGGGRDPLRRGAEIEAWGYTHTSIPVERAGLTVSSHMEQGIILATPFIAKGISGGPILHDGLVIGIVAARDAGQNHTFLLSSSTFTGFLSERGIVAAAPKRDDERRAPVWLAQRQLMARHDLFGGRDIELGRLEALRTGSPLRYHFITGKAGFGKTALLANWVLRLERDQVPVCFHFINRARGMSAEEQALRNLCEQLMRAHQVGGSIPVGIDLLYARYETLLRRPLRQGALTVVLDGLDEAEEWTPGPRLFPHELPETTRVFFSVRTDSRRRRLRWLARLDLDQAEVDFLKLEKLDDDAVAALLKSALRPRTPLANSFVKAVAEKSKGDPFYLHFLVKDIVAGHITTANIDEQVAGVDAFLAGWRRDLENDVGARSAAVDDLLGLLTFALGPLTSGDIKKLSPVLAHGSVLNDLLTRQLDRYRSGDEESGYTLCHPRFGDYLRTHDFRDDESYSKRLLEFCSQWASNQSRYALNQYLAHLVRQGETDRVFEVFDRDWKIARARLTGSPRAFAADLEFALRLAARQNTPRSLALLKLSCAYATIVSSSRMLSPLLVEALIEVGTVSAALDYAALNSDALSQCRFLVAGASALLRLGQVRDAREFAEQALRAAESYDVVDDDTRELKISLFVDFLPLLHRASAADALARAVRQLRRLAMGLQQRGILGRVATAFRSVGESHLAEEFERRREASEKPFMDFSNLNLEGVFGNSRVIEPLNIDNPDRGQLHQLIADNANNEEPRRSRTLVAIAKSLNAIGEAEFARSIALDLDSALADTAPAEQFAWRVEVAVLLLETGALAEGAELALQAVEEIDVDQFWQWNWYQVERLTSALGVAGCDDDARELASTVAEVMRRAPEFSRQELLTLAARELARTDQPSEARGILDEIIASHETLGPELSRQQMLLRLVVCALDADQISGASRSLLGKVVDRAGSVIRDLFTSRPGEQARQALRALTRARLALDPASPVADLTELADQAQGLERALARDVVARCLAENGRNNETFAISDETVTDIINPAAKKDAAWGEAVLAIAMTRALADSKPWAVNASNAISGVQTAELAARKAEVLLAAGAREDAVALAREQLKGCMFLRSDAIENDFQPLIAALRLADDPREVEVLHEAQATVDAQISWAPWQFRALGIVMLESARRHERAFVDRLVASVRKIDEPQKMWDALIVCARALAEAGRHGLSGELAGEVFDACAERWPASLAVVYALLAKPEKVLEVERSVVYQRPDETDEKLELLEAYACLHDSDAINRLLEEWTQPREDARRQLFIHAILWSRGARYLARLDLQDDAARAARRGLDFFMQVTDGSLTPDVLPELVPALVVTRDADGLFDLVNMPADKRPYEREYVPAWRLVFPALARLGAIGEGFAGIGEHHVRALKSASAETFAATQAETAIAFFENGDSETARAYLADIEIPYFVGVAQVGLVADLIRSNDHVEARKLTLAALANTVASAPSVRGPEAPSRIELLHRLLKAWREVPGPRREVAWNAIVEQLGEISSGSVASVAMERLQPSLRVLCAAHAAQDLERAAVMLSRADPRPRAEGLTTLAQGQHRAGERSAALAHARNAEQAIDMIADASQRALPLARLAFLMWRLRRRKKATGLFWRAVDIARLNGRTTYFEVLETAGPIVLSQVGVGELVETLDEVDSWWT